MTVMKDHDDGHDDDMSLAFRLSIREIVTLNDDYPLIKDAIVMLDPGSTASDLRKALCADNIIKPDDAFMLPDDPEFALAKIDEVHKPWQTVQTDKDIITVLTKEYGPGALRGGTFPGGALRRSLSHSHNFLNLFPTGLFFGKTSSNGRNAHTSSDKSSEVLPMASTTNVLNASDLSPDRWEELVSQQTSILHGIVLGTGRASDDLGPQWAPRPLIQYTSDSITHSVSDGTKSGGSIFNTLRNHRYAQNGWVDSEVKATSPYASASIEANLSETFGHDITNKTIHVTNSYIIPRAKVQFARQSLKFTEEFTKQLAASLNKPTDEEKQVALGQLFESYGHVFPLQVVLGGTFIQSTEGQANSDKDMEATKNELRASLYTSIFGTGVGGGNWREYFVTINQVIFKCSIQILGGDSTIQDPNEWMESVKNDHNWRVVRIEKVVPIIDLLSKEDREEIIRVAPPKFKALRGKWVDLGSHHLLDGICKGLRRFGVPDITDEGWFWLGQSQDDRVLIVREEIPGSLGKISRIDPIWNSKGKWPWLGTVNYLGNPFPEQSGTFSALGSCAYSHPMFALGDPRPDLKAGPWSKLRAVRNELLIKGECEDTEVWQDEGKHGPSRASVWLIKHNGHSINLGSFKAFPGRKKKTVGVWRLKAEDIYIENEK